MGSPTARRALLLLLLLLLLLSLSPAAAPRSRLPTVRLQQVTANFQCETKAYGALPKPQRHRTLWEGPVLPVPTLNLSTVQLCQPECQPCVRVQVSLNATGIRGLELQFLVQSTNRSGGLHIWRRKYRKDTKTLWQLQFDCFPAENREFMLVSLETIPRGVLSLNKSLLVITEEPSPEFHHRWIPAARAIEVSVSEGPAITVRLCHKLALVCEEPLQPFHQQVLVDRHHPAVLPYEFLFPCLCIEAFFNQGGVRNKVCPFEDHQEAYGPELWSSTEFVDESSIDEAKMIMDLNVRCPFHPTASLCWKENITPEAICQDIPNSTASRVDLVYSVEEVDVHPQLCFKFSYRNSSHVECPHTIDTAWDVSVSVRFLQLHLHFHSRIPASFSSALCQQKSLNQCELEPPVYTITHSEGSGLVDLDLILPWQATRSCILVWRSDVHFAGKRLICPNVSRRHWGLLAFGLGLGLGLLAAVILLIFRGLRRCHRDIPSRRHSRPILLIYSPDSEEHKQLVCAFAALLRSALGCPVLLDLWELSHVGKLGVLPWMYAQREHVGREQGQVLLLWSAGSAGAYGLWQGKANASPTQAPEPHDLFGAAMACLQGEQQSTAGAGRRSDWVIAYFSKLCGQRDIPHALRYLPCYRLPQKMPALVKFLQGSSSSAPSWLRTSAKALVCRLLRAEQQRRLQSQRPQPWRPTTERLASTILAPLKLHRTDCT